MIISLGGDSVVIWPFRPLESHTEALEFLTDIMQPYAAEQRVALRTKPRQRIEYSYTVNPQQYSRMKAFVRYNGAGVWGVPVWHEQTEIGALSATATEILFDTVYADYRDAGYAIVWQSDDTFEIVTIDTIASDRLNLSSPLTGNYTRAYVAPLRKARMPNLAVEASRNKGTYSDVSASFFILDTVDLSAVATPYTTYNGYQVLEDRPVRIADLNESIIWPQSVFDNQTGVIATDTVRGQPFQSTSVTWNTGICGTARESLWNIRTWLHSMRGRALSFYMPSWNNDLNLAADIGALDTTITVDLVGVDTYLGDATDIMILLRDGTRYYRGVTNSSEGATTETLTISSSLGTAVTVAEVEMISVLALSRLDSDRIEIAHTNGGSTISIPVIEVPA